MAARLADALLFAALVLVGLSAGLFVGWSVSVIPGTQRVADGAYIETMQRVNVAILNAPFFVLFLGPGPMLAAAAVALRYSAGSSAARAWLAGAAALVYVVGVVGVTVARNVPLNDALAAFALDGADAGALRVVRASYERPWNRWHRARSAASAAAFALASLAALAS